MSPDPVLPEVLDGFDRALRRRPARRRWFAPRALGIALVGLAIGGTAIAAVAPWNPMGAGASEAATTTPPPPDQLNTLAVLRRAQTDGDRGPLITAFLKRERVRPLEGRVRLPYVRYLREVESRLGMVDAGSADRGELGTASLYLIPRAAPSKDEQDPRLAGQDPLQFCLTALYAAEGGVSGGGTCGSAHVVRMKGLSTGGAAGGNVIGIVPDDVAAVRALTRDGRSVEARVEHNAFQLLAPGRNLPPDPDDRDDRPWAPPLSGQFKSGTYEWLDARGVVIRRMPY